MPSEKSKLPPLRMVVPKPNKTRLVEVEDENGMVQVGVVERMTEKGEIVVKILANDKRLVFKPGFKV